MPHIVLLGDSIFDNAAYVPGELPVIEQLRARLPENWQATLLAVDGDINADIDEQIRGLPEEATHLVISSGGNVALGQLRFLEVPTDKHWVGLPVCVGIAPTKTLAKLVNHVAKKRPQFMLTEIIAATHRMPTLFDDTVGMARSKNLMHAVDSINQAYGRGTIRLAAEGLDQRWKMRAGRRSPAFTTCLSDVVVAHAT